MRRPEAFHGANGRPTCESAPPRLPPHLLWVFHVPGWACVNGSVGRRMQGRQLLTLRLRHASGLRQPLREDPSSYRVKSPIQAAKASAVASVLRRSTSNTTRASFRARQRIASRCVLPSARFRARYAFARS